MKQFVKITAIIATSKKKKETKKSKKVECSALL